MIRRVVLGDDSFSIHGRFDGDGLFFLMEEGDVISDEDFERLEEFVSANPEGDIFLLPKKYEPSRKSKKGIMYAPFSYNDKIPELTSGKITPELLKSLHGFFPFGMIFRGSLLNNLMEETKAEGTFDSVLIRGSHHVLIWLMTNQAEAAISGKLYYIGDVAYYLANSFEGDKTFFEGVYDRSWYEDYVKFLKHWLKELSYSKSEHINGEIADSATLISDVAMTHATFIVKFMIQANLDNVNKHLFEENEGSDFLRRLGEVLTFVDDSVICDNDGYHVDMKNEDCLIWVLLILKYRNNNLQFEFDNGYFGYKGIRVGSLYRHLEDAEQDTKKSVAATSKKVHVPTADIQFMDTDDGVGSSMLKIEGRISPILLMNNAKFGVLSGKDFYPAELEERYAHTKAFGTTIFKLTAFKVNVKLRYNDETKLAFVTRYENPDTGQTEDIPVTLEFDSHFSRLCDRFKNSYWKINKYLYMYRTEDNIMLVRPVTTGKMISRELALWKDMIATRQKKVIKFILVRAFLKAKPLLKHKPIWLFFDKIYKAGDSAEYLYRYCLNQNDGVKCYYLADGSSEDFTRMEAEGLKPVRRRSLKHRYAFLYADMIIVSNSTVYAFNDFGTINSALIRDLMNFHTVCVQHGMSVQKIAVAQNRLRDNTRLYFCASKYEIENLSKPIYGYQGYDALKLTGVPRYDGLVNNDKRQILLTPTWRMQAAVPVTKNEGVSRDYNPLFKETDYYRVYNSLINDSRLIAAAKEYNYKILYVLHPIVSPQLDDFDKNDYVEIIPAVGVNGHAGVNYEKAFCESSLMVSDFSGVQFDFAYMRKPVVYLHHKDIPKHYEEGTFHYDTMGFGEICHDNDELISVLISYMKNDCQMKPEYRRRADDFFEFNDHDNCRRIYDVMIDYQKNLTKN